MGGRGRRGYRWGGAGGEQEEGVGGEGERG